MVYIENVITVDELKYLYKSNKYYIDIDTPDGWQKIIRWWDKGELQTIKITCNDAVTVCATNHLLEVKHEEGLTWKLASELTLGEQIYSKDGLSEIVSLEIQGIEECYDFKVDHPNHRYWGDGFSSHNSGKSYLASGNIAANAQKDGHFVVLLDSENALDKKWLHDLGVSTDSDKLLKISVTMIDDVAKLIFDFVKDYRSQYEKVPREDRPKVLFIIDSLGMLLTPTDFNQFQAGDLKGDMGRKPKALNALIRNCVNMFGDLDIGLVATNHSYASQNVFSPDPVISGGGGWIFGSSIVIATRKLHLKEDEEGEKTSDVKGIRAICKCMKTRYNKPFEQVELRIPWDSGLDPYSGLVDLFKRKELLIKDGNKLAYTALDGSSQKFYEKRIPNSLLDLIMQEFSTHLESRKIIQNQTSPEDYDPETGEIIESNASDNESSNPNNGSK